MTAPGDANSLVVLNLRPGNYFLLRWYIFIWYHFFEISKVLWKKDYEFEKKMGLDNIFKGWYIFMNLYDVASNNNKVVSS